MRVRLSDQVHAFIDTYFEAHLARTETFLREPSIWVQNIGVHQCANLLRGWLIECGA